MSKSSNQSVMYKCAALGPHNNGRLRKCDFKQMFPEMKDLYHCPQCGNRLVKVDDIDSQ